MIADLIGAEISRIFLHRQDTAFSLILGLSPSEVNSFEERIQIRSNTVPCLKRTTNFLISFLVGFVGPGQMRCI
jgi:hypothetical protein